MTDIKAKYLGGMVGSALGDAIGKLAFHYPSKDDLCIQLDRLKELSYTDASAMSIVLAESILKKAVLINKTWEKHSGTTLSVSPGGARLHLTC